MSKASKTGKKLSVGIKVLIIAAIVVAIPAALLAGGYAYCQSVYSKNVQTSAVRFAEYPEGYTVKYEPDKADIKPVDFKNEAAVLSLSGILGAYNSASLAEIQSGFETFIYTDGADKSENLSLLLIETVPYSEDDPLKALIPEGRQKANSITVLYFNEPSKKIHIVSLEPETLVPVEGFDMNTLQGAYAIGGAGMLTNSVNDFYGTSIRNYFEVNLDSIIRYADKLGGVKLNVTQADIDRFGLTGIQPGENALTGDNAHALLTKDTRRQEATARQLQQNYYQGLYTLIFNQNSLSALSGFSSENRIGTNLSLIDFAATVWNLRWAISPEMQYTLATLPEKTEPSDYIIYKGAFIALNLNHEETVKALSEVLRD